MAAIAAEARKHERAVENSEGSHIPTLEPALRRAPSPSSRADHKGEWPSISQLTPIGRSFETSSHRPEVYWENKKLDC